jgi:hypothetical protein
MTGFDELYETLRIILGDEEVHGIWNYSDEKLDSAVKSVFLLGRGPDGYALNSGQDGIEPSLTAGDPYALVCYDASLLMVGGEDGAVRVHTREITLTDEGHRKRDLLIELRQLIYQIRDGAAVFMTSQNFDEFVHSLRPGFPFNMAKTEVVTTPPEINF